VDAAALPALAVHLHHRAPCLRGKAARPDG